MEKIAAYTLRPVQEEDEALLLELYASTRADELALVPWDAEQKQAFCKCSFPPSKSITGLTFPMPHTK